MPWVVSTSSITFSAATGEKKLGQPVPLLNFESDENSGRPQQMQA